MYPQALGNTYISVSIVYSFLVPAPALAGTGSVLGFALTYARRFEEN